MFKGLIGSTVNMGEMLYQGKVKQVWSTDDPDILEFRFTNQISVFDQIIPSLIPRKGESLNRTTAHWFKLIEEEGICGTHLVEVNAADRCLVRKVEVIKEPGANLEIWSGYLFLWKSFVGIIFQVQHGEDSSAGN